MDRFCRHTDYLIIAGPTASGKSALALALAQKCDGVIINADSVQLYADLRILSARPSVEDERQVPHQLYGFVDGGIRFSVAMWLNALHEVVDKARNHGKWPILVGGTGFYLQAACYGLSPIPDIDDDIRRQVIAECDDKGSIFLHNQLQSYDPKIAARLPPTDTQRIIRACEVYRQTGRTLSDWQEQPLRGGLTGKALNICQMPSRDIVYEAIENRFDVMVSDSQLWAEIEALLARNLPLDQPIMKALGVKPLASYLSGDIVLERAIYLAKRDSRRYAKRQMTWLRNNFISKVNNNEKLSKSFLDKIISKISNLL